jgi:hypothetical protein
MERRIELKDKIAGFTERDAHSKAILNTDRDALLKYRIQKQRYSKLNQNNEELNKMKTELSDLKNDLCEIKQLLLTITNKV